MKTAQYVIAVFLVATLLRGLWTDMYGVKEHEPYGFSGAIMTLSITALMAWIYYTAGAFSLIWR